MHFETCYAHFCYSNYPINRTKYRTVRTSYSHNVGSKTATVRNDCIFFVQYLIQGVTVWLRCVGIQFPIWIGSSVGTKNNGFRIGRKGDLIRVDYLQSTQILNFNPFFLNYSLTLSPPSNDDTNSSERFGPKISRFFRTMFQEISRLW